MPRFSQLARDGRGVGAFRPGPPGRRRPGLVRAARPGDDKPRRGRPESGRKRPESRYPSSQQAGRGALSGTKSNRGAILPSNVRNIPDCSGEKRVHEAGSNRVARHAARTGSRRRPQRPHERGGGERPIGQRRHLVHPVAPAQHEPRPIAEGPSRIHIESAGFRQHGREFRHRDCPELRIHPTQYPEQHDQVRIAQSRGQSARESQDAHPHRAAEHHGQAKSQPENPRQRTRCLNHYVDLCV